MTQSRDFTQEVPLQLVKSSAPDVAQLVHYLQTERDLWTAK